jgi:hypothetical protein
MVDLLARWVTPSSLTAASAGVVHAIKWPLQCRYMQIEGMAELTPPLIDAELGRLPPNGSLTNCHLKLQSNLHHLDGHDLRVQETFGGEDDRKPSQRSASTA